MIHDVLAYNIHFVNFEHKHVALNTKPKINTKSKMYKYVLSSDAK